MKARYVFGIGAGILLSGMYANWEHNMNSYMVSRFPLSIDLNLQDSSEGRISTIYTSVNLRDGKLEELDKVGDFFNAEVVLMTDQEVVTDLDVTVEPIRVVQHFWTRDLFMLTQDSVLTHPIASTSTSRGWKNETRLVDQIEDSMEVISRRENLGTNVAPFRFEGGQLIKTEQGVFVPDVYSDHRWIFAFMFNGYDQQGLAQPGVCCDELYEDLFFTNAVYVPNLVVTSEFPDGRMMYSGHIDMLMTPGTNGKWLVADPDLGEELWAKADPIQKQNFVSRMHETSLQEEGYELELVVENVWSYPMGQEVRQNLRDVLEFMEENFEVVRVPYPVMVIDGDHLGFAYTNALVEEGRGKALFSSYGIESIDAAAAEAFAEAGYDDQMRVDGLMGLLTKSGPHCDYLEVRK